MLGFTEKEVGHMTLKKWSLLYKHFRAYHNFCTQQQLFNNENGHLKDNDEWLPDYNGLAKKRELILRPKSGII